MSLLIEHCDVLHPSAPRGAITDQSILVVGKRIAAIGKPDDIARLAAQQPGAHPETLMAGQRGAQKSASLLRQVARQARQSPQDDWLVFEQTLMSQAKEPHKLDGHHCLAIPCLISAREAVDAATLGGAAAMLLKGELGELKAGQLADIVLLDKRSPVLSPLNDAYNLLAYCELGGSVQQVIVNGEIVVRDRRLITFDAGAIAAEFRERVHALPVRQPIDSKTSQDVDAWYAFWRDVMDRVKTE